MNLHTDLLRTEAHTDIGATIERDAEMLTEQWCRHALAEHSAAKRVHFSALRDHLPAFLRSMGRGLMQAAGTAEERRRGLAAEHGGVRWDQGWSITELVADYQLLQVVVLAHLERTLARPLHTREMMAVGVFIDDAVAASLTSYVESRDEELSRRESERAAELEAANRRKDDFLGVLGHEMRNPLAPIHTSLKILHAALKDPPVPVRTAVEVIERQSRLLTRLADDLLDVARIGQGRLELRKSTLALRAVLEQAVQTSEPLIAACDHALELELPPQTVTIEGDAQRLVQVVCNLLNNAAKYTPRGGRISLSGRAEGDAAVIVVADNGIGIPADMLESVFTPFAQVESARAQSQGGIGIGLTLVRELVEQHGGTVSCRSEGEGRGAEFVVRLPLSGAAPGDPRSGARGPLRVEPLPKTSR